MRIRSLKLPEVREVRRAFASNCPLLPKEMTKYGP